jgi:uncharacterized protein
MRILVLIAIALLLYVILTNLFRRQAAEKKAAAKKVTEQMVKCDHCGLHVLQQEAIRQGQHYFCSSQHLEDFNKS